ncbi:MAG TPA: helix-turn-helix transcriptional regulator [Trebonia sp.]|jgi:DNA-binding XRE family transcriptional regulator|nr:helix-turn-helix transcriptional regulator [Trebonia sp.]
MTRGRKQELSPSASPVHFFGSEVRRAREDAGLTQAGLATLVPCDPSTVSRIEAGALAPDRRFADTCDETFPGLRGWFGRFYAGFRDWNNPFATPFRPFAQYEAAATAIYTLEHSLIPGLLQTEEYARIVLGSHPGVSEGEIEERVTARLARQAVLDREDAPMVWTVIDESVLSKCVGGLKTMHAALSHVLDLASRPNVVVQVLADVGAHVGLQGSVHIAETADAVTAAILSDFSDGRVVEDPSTVAALMMRFRWLQADALPAAASRKMIEQITEEQWNRES